MAQTNVCRSNDSIVNVERLFPSGITVADELPERARNYLSQAKSSLNAPDGCVMLAGSAVDAMLKEKGLTEGSVYTRIDEAVTQNILTQEMADWAHEVRLGSNRPRHADQDHPHMTLDEAKQALEFSEMLGHILFVLPARVAEGRASVTAETAD